MELNHRFTVPAAIDEAWAAFNDLERIAPCFPGAALTSYDGHDFAGLVKVKLGPISLQYNGTGTFLERDEVGYKAVIEAKGKDKRGNGTAAATVTTQLTARDDGSTDVEVLTALNITGKPAQFGRGVMQDVSDKLLGQFATCLETKLMATETEPEPEREPEPEQHDQQGTEPAEEPGPEASAEATAKPARSGKTAASKTTSSTATSSKAAGSQPAESEPADSQPAESKPAASKPAASKPAASKPAASKPAHSKAAHAQDAAAAAATAPTSTAPTSTAPTSTAPTSTAAPTRTAAPTSTAAPKAAPGPPTPAPATTSRSAQPAHEPVELNLMTTVLPVLLKRYAPYLVAGLVGLVLVWRVVRGRR